MVGKQAMIKIDWTFVLEIAFFQHSALTFGKLLIILVTKYRRTSLLRAMPGMSMWKTKRFPT